MKRSKVFESEVWSALLWVMLGLLFALLASLAYGDAPTDSARPAQAQDKRLPQRAGAQPKVISEVVHPAPGQRHGFEAAQQKLRQTAALHADARRAMMNTQSRAHLTAMTGRIDAAAGVPRLGNRGSPMHDALPQPKVAVARNSLIGGPGVQNTGQLGRAVVGRTNHSGAIVGTQLQRHFRLDLH